MPGVLKVIWAIAAIGLSLAAGGCVCCGGLDGLRGYSIGPVSEILMPEVVKAGGNEYLLVGQAQYASPEEIKQVLTSFGDPGGNGTSDLMQSVISAAVDLSGVRGLKTCLYLKSSPEAQMLKAMMNTTTGMPIMPWDVNIAPGPAGDWNMSLGEEWWASDGWPDGPAGQWTGEEDLAVSPDLWSLGSIGGPGGPGGVPYAAIMLVQLRSPAGTSLAYEAMKQAGSQANATHEGSFPAGDGGERYYFADSGQHWLVFRYSTMFVMVIADSDGIEESMTATVVEAIRATGS